GEIYSSDVRSFVFTGNPNFVGGVLVGLVVSNVYVVLHVSSFSQFPCIFQGNLQVYSVWHDFAGVVFVRQVVNFVSFVQLSLLNEVSNAVVLFDQVDGPVLVDVAGVVTVFNGVNEVVAIGLPFALFDFAEVFFLSSNFWQVSYNFNAIFQNILWSNSNSYIVIFYSQNTSSYANICTCNSSRRCFCNIK